MALSASGPASDKTSASMLAIKAKVLGADVFAICDLIASEGSQESVFDDIFQFCILAR